MSRGDAFSGVALTPPGARSWRQRLCGGRFFRNTTQSRASDPAHTAIPLSSCIFLHGRAGWRGGN